LDGFLDIYSRLVIAILSFTAPLITYLLSVFGIAIEQTKKKAKEKERTVAEILRRQMNEMKADNNVADFIATSNKRLKTEKRNDKRKINLLNPKRQILRIFIPLILSIISLMFYKLIKDPRLAIYSHKLAVGLILFSVICFVVSLYVQKQVAWAVIEAKTEMDQDSLLENVEKAEIIS